MRVSQDGTLLPALPFINAAHGLRIVDETTQLRLDYDKHYADVRDYGVTSGLTIWNTQLQQACDDLAAAGGGTLYFPGGSFRLSAKLNCPNVRLKGAGIGLTELLWTTDTGTSENALGYGLDQQPVAGTPPKFAIIEDMELQGPLPTGGFGATTGFTAAIKMANGGVVRNVSGGGWFAGYVSLYGNEFLNNTRVGGAYGLWYGDSDNPGGMYVVDTELSGSKVASVGVHWNGVIRNLCLQGVHVGFSVYCFRKLANPVGGTNGRSFIEGLTGIDLGAEAYSAGFMRADTQLGADIEDVAFFATGTANPMQTDYDRGSPALPMTASVRCGALRRWRPLNQDIAWYAGTNYPPIVATFECLSMEDCRFDAQTPAILRSNQSGLPFAKATTVHNCTIRDFASEHQLFKASGAIAVREAVGLTTGGAVRKAQSGDIVVGIAATPAADGDVVVVTVWGAATAKVAAGTVNQVKWVSLDPANAGAVVEAAAWSGTDTFAFASAPQSSGTIQVRLFGTNSSDPHVQ